MSETNSFNAPDANTGPSLSVDSEATKISDVAGHALLERIGVGGMGEVYRCDDDALGRDLAIKILRAELHGDAGSEERFLREARLTGSLQHPGVVPVHHLGRLADGRPCYTMKLVRGRTLADLLREEPDGPERLPRLLAIVEKVCQAVAFAHSKGVLHRDLKPSNVMVGEFGEVQVMDWGLAKELSRAEPAATSDGATENVETVGRVEEAAGLSRAGAALGTPAYMPPEQAAGDWDIVDQRADVFALGAILCAALTGRPPYQGASRDEVLRRARRGDLAEALRRLEQCGADAALVDLCRECLSAEREGRPRHAGVVAERLASYQAEVRERLRRVELERVRAEVQAQEQRKRRRLRAALALAALVLLSGGALVWLHGQRRQAEADGAALQVMGETQALREQARADPLNAAGYDKAVLTAEKAGDVARTGGASLAVRRQADDLLAEVRQEAEEAEQDRRFLARLLEVRGPREGPKYNRDDKGAMTALAERTAEEQFASAFRDWGLEVDTVPAAEAAARLKGRPAAVVTEVIAALDEWASQRRLDQKPEAAQRLAELAAALDKGPGSERREEVRQILARDQLPVERALGVLSAALRPVPVPLAVPSGKDHRRLRRLAEHMNPAVEPVLGVLTLTGALRVAGEEALAERLLRQASDARPDEVVLHHTLGQLLTAQEPPRWVEAVEFYRAARARRPEVGVNLATALRHSGKEPEGLDLLARLVQKSPDNPYLRFEQGRALWDKGDLDGAIACYQTALKLDPKYAHALINLGATLCDDKHDLDGAIACFHKALDLNPKDAKAHTNLGVVLAERGDRDGAIAYWKKALALDPKDAHIHYNLGNALKGKGDRDGAIVCYQKALDLNPKYALAHYNLGNALKDKHDLDGAIACYHKALDLNPKDAKAHTNLGIALLAKHDLDGAIICFQKGLDLDPKFAFALAHYNLGIALRAKGDLDGAIACYQKAIALDPKFAEAHHNLGNALYDKHDLDGAIACWKKVLDLDPKDAMAHNNLGNALRDKHDRDGALTCFQKAIDLDPKFAPAHYNLANALRDKGDLGGAIACYQKAIALDPNYAHAHNGLGLALYAKHDWDGAIACYQKAIVLDPKLAQAHNGLGAILCDVKRDRDGAIACFQKAIALNPKDAIFSYNLGNALRDKGDQGGAIACYHKALDLDPKFAPAHTSLGDAQRAKGDWDGAIACYRKAIALDPKYAEAHNGLGNALYEKHDLDGAITCYKKALDLSPKDAKTHTNLGNALRDKGNLSDALASCRKALELDPKLAPAHVNLGNVLYAKGDRGGAIACYRKAIALDPKYAEAHNGLGNALYTKQDLDGAIASCRKALDLNPKYAGAYNNLGAALKVKGDLNGAIACYQKAIELDSKLAMAHNNLGVALYDKHNLDGAIACYKKAIELNPNDVLAHNNLGNALRAKDNLDGAIACYHKALDLNPQDALAHCNLGFALQQQGRFTEAVVSLRRGHELGSKRPGWPDPSGQRLRYAEHLAALDSQLPAVLRGEASPGNAGEALTLAMMCQQHKKRYTGAVRLFADAFAAEPKIATDMNRQHRYNAACCAALAAAGEGEDAGRLPDKVVTMFRHWALGWLRDDLTAYAQLATQNNPAVKQAIQQRLAHWRSDSDFSSVRDPLALDLLADHERAAWLELWHRVDALAQRVAKKDEPTKGRQERENPKTKP